MTFSDRRLALIRSLEASEAQEIFLRKLTARWVAFERGVEPGWWYVSINNEDGKSIGGCFVQGQGTYTAVDRSRRLKILPENALVKAFEVPAEALPLVPESARERLLTVDELLVLFPGRMYQTDGEGNVLERVG